MRPKSLQSTVLGATAMVVLALGLHYAIVYEHHIPLTVRHVAMSLLIVPMALGFVGVRMLTQLGRHETVRTIRYLAVGLAIPVGFAIVAGTPVSAFIPIAGAAILASAFVLALWARASKGPDRFDGGPTPPGQPGA